MVNSKKTKEAEEWNMAGSCFCPWCGHEIPGDSVYCPNCGSYVLDTEKNRRKWKKGILFPMAAAGAAVIVLLLSALLKSQWDAGSREADGTLFYIKDNSIFGVEPGSGKEPEEYSVQYLEKWGSRNGGGILADQADNPLFSESGGYLYYPEEKAGGSFNLVRKDLKKGGEKTLDTEVIEFKPVGAERVIYRRENQALYYYNGTRKQKITGEVSFYQASESGDALMWLNESQGLADLYYKRLDSDEKPIRLERNIELLGMTGDFSRIFIQKEDAIYQIANQGQAELLVDEAEQAAGADAEKGTFYYTKAVDRTPTTSYKELYYFEGGKGRLLDDSFQSFAYEAEDVVLYTRMDDKLGCYLATNGTTGELGRNVVLPGQIEKSGDRLYFMSEESIQETRGRTSYILCYIPLTSGKREPAREVDGGVSALSCIAGGRVYYTKEAEGGTGDLYCDGSIAAYDVSIASVSVSPESQEVYCIADYNRMKRKGTLIQVLEGDVKQIASDVSGYSVIGTDSIFILSDYSFEKEHGDLLYYDGAELLTIDTGIWGYYDKRERGKRRGW